MADSTIDDQKFVLEDQWPGEAQRAMAIPDDGFVGTSHHNVATAVYPIGTKIQVYCPGSAVYGTKSGNAGYSTFIYLKLEEMDGTNTCRKKHFVTTESTQTASVADNVYDVTNDVATALGIGGLMPAAVALGTASGGVLTENYYGWYWCGGVCPVDYVDALDGDYSTLGDVAIGPVVLGQLVSPGTTAGEIGLDLRDGDAELVIGYANSVDA